jgi:glycerophosphoryl diester phosphodiesterase
MGDNMNKRICKAALLMATAAAVLAISGTALADDNSKRNSHKPRGADKSGSVQLGARPFFLVDDMSEGPLKRQLQRCTQRRTFTPREFSIGHRGAAMQFPEHTAESYTAAARMGALL